MSEPACAALYDRIERLPHWSFFYDRQNRRIERLAAQFAPEMKPYAHGVRLNSPTAHIPFITPTHVGNDRLNNPYFVIRKHDDLASKNQNSIIPSSKAYERIVCIPCHPQIRHVSNDAIVSVLKAISAH